MTEVNGFTVNAELVAVDGDKASFRFDNGVIISFSVGEKLDLKLGGYRCTFFPKDLKWT